jgi:CheY-like chemotaxis protein
MEATGLLLCSDMIFSSRITGTARDLGMSIKPARSADALLALAQQQAPRCVIIDLANPGLEIAEFVLRLQETCTPTPCLVAYGSHVDADGLRAAREAGCHFVLPRSKFVQELPTALPKWMTTSQ